MQSPRLAAVVVRKPCLSRTENSACDGKRQTKQGGAPVRHPARAEFPCRHTAFALHRARCPGQNVMDIVSRYGLPPPGKIGKLEQQRSNAAYPKRAFSGRNVVGGAKGLERICDRDYRAFLHDGMIGAESCRWPGAAIVKARAVTAVMPGRGGSLDGTLTFQASPSASSNCTKCHPRSICPG